MTSLLAHPLDTRHPPANLIKQEDILIIKLIKNFKPRLYQETIFATTSRANTLVVLPTGMGKTNIFLMLAAHRLTQYPNSKILLIGPTRPLIDQYFRVFEKHFEIDKEKMAVFTGLVKPEVRQELWKKAQIIFSTPQGLENDIIGSKIALDDVSLLGVDEAHRAVGDYSYVFIASQYEKKARYPRIIGMTASPGSELEKINEVIRNLHIEEIEIRTDSSPDVAEYIQELNIRWLKVELPEDFRSIQKYLNSCYMSKLKEIKSNGYLAEIQSFGRSKRDLLGLQGTLQGEIASGNRDPMLLRSVSLAAEALKVQHATELLETQGIDPLCRYLEDIDRQSRTSKVRAVQNLVRDINFRSALIKTRSLFEKGIEHPKLDELKKIVSGKISSPGYKIIVFTQYRDSGVKIVDELGKVENAKPVLFVGQAKKNGTGLTQKNQIEILGKFRDNEYNVLVSSSVGEEGLDIPQVDCVIFYEPIPSAIRHIQRRGRTARMDKGEVLILMAKGTRDEAYKWTAHHKEKRMYRTLESLKRTMTAKKVNADLSRFGKKEAGVKISADYREKASGVIKELIDMGAEIDLGQLEVADYICSQRCGIEFKTVPDFVDSLIDGRLLHQVRALKQNFEKPLIIIEGNQDMFSVRNIHPNALRGLLATIAVSFGVPMLQTKNYKDTAGLIIAIAKREQEEYGKDYSPHRLKKPMTLREQQEYLISALPGVGPSLARPLLSRFGSVKEIMNSDVDKLKDVEQIGDVKANKIREVIDNSYG